MSTALCYGSSLSPLTGSTSLSLPRTHLESRRSPYGEERMLRVPDGKVLECVCLAVACESGSRAEWDSGVVTASETLSIPEAGQRLVQESGIPPAPDVQENDLSLSSR